MSTESAILAKPIEPSLPEVHSSVRISGSPIYWRRLLGFLGPGFLISVGYMDPGNWATDIAGGSQFGYTLLFVIMASNLIAILLQSLSLKLGIATERDPQLLLFLHRNGIGPRKTLLVLSQNYDQTVSIELDSGSSVLGRPAAEAVWLLPATTK